MQRRLQHLPGTCVQVVGVVAVVVAIIWGLKLVGLIGAVIVLVGTLWYRTSIRRTK